MWKLSILHNNGEWQSVCSSDKKYLQNKATEILNKVVVDTWVTIVGVYDSAEATEVSMFIDKESVCGMNLLRL